uniref:CSON011310 protein n=1 Tax=Culicoides sonorensis TaxID=179676 RepID=A0A336LLS5_CULSO
MSRLIIKNLPKRIDEQRLKEIFNQKGNVTDIQLKFTKDGKFRQFGFIGYENDIQAQEAVKFFDKTFIQTSRISVELCKDLSQNSGLDISNPIDVNKKKDNYINELVNQHKDDPLFKEFIDIHGKPKSLWQDDVVPQPMTEIIEENNDLINETKEKIADKNISDKDYMKSLIKKTEKCKKPMVELYTVKLRNLPKNTKRQDVQKFFKPLKPHSVRIPGLKLRFAYAGFKTKQELLKALTKHKSFFNGKQIEVYDFSSKSILPINSSNENKNSKWEGQTKSLDGEESICESGKLFFRNLPYSVTEDELQKKFESFGPIAHISVPLDAITRKNKGFGTITFVMPEHAVKAYSNLNGTMFHGRMFHILPGKIDDKDKEDEQVDDDLNYKKKKDAKLKKTASSAHNWNTLFMGPNVVAELLAKDYQTSKEGVLDVRGSGSNAAVRLALGETEIVQKMKEFLEENGVCLKSFNGLIKERSKTVLLAKNLAPGTTIQELRPMFAKFGPLGRVILPPFGVSCLIEYLDQSEAKKAFKSLAYKMFKGIPLYLEWAPELTFIEKSSTHTNTHTEVSKIHENNTPKTESVENITDDESPEENTTLFIKNLSPETEESVISRHFAKLGPIHSVQIVKKPDPKNTQFKISAGYGFIQFKKRDSLEKALKLLQFSELMGNKIELKRSDRTLKDTPIVRKSTLNIKQTGTKILIRNIAFQAKESELQDIFKVFGEIKALRLPKKLNADTHRGFGFVEFYTKEEAKRAFETLSESTHFYGRRLVLEWAINDSVEEIRKRTADHFSGDPKKKAKKGPSVFNVENLPEVID